MKDEKKMRRLIRDELILQDKVKRINHFMSIGAYGSQVEIDRDNKILKEYYDKK